MGSSERNTFGKSVARPRVISAVFYPGDRYPAASKEGTLTVSDMHRVLKGFATDSKEKP